MASTRLNTSVFVSVISLGGEDLRNQLLADLRQFETELENYCLTRPEDTSGSDRHLASVLHNLCGLATTIGADALARLCQQLDIQSDAYDRASRLQSVANVINEIVLVRAQVQQFSVACS